MLLKKVLVLEHVADSGGDRSVLPRGVESFLCVCDSRVEFGISGLGHMTDNILGQGVQNIELLGASALNPLAVDVVAVLGGRLRGINLQSSRIFFEQAK